jgi:hypothetical protein
MPGYKEISKLKTELIDRRESKIKGSLTYQQNHLYESVVNDFVMVAKDKVEGRPTNLYALQRELKRQYELSFPSVMQEAVKASSAINNLNLKYFSTLVDTNRLDEIAEKTDKVVNKSLGIDENGLLKENGFIDKTLESKKVQRMFVKEVNNILDGSPDLALMQHKLKEFITGTKQSTGLLERYYRTFANDLLANIDRTGSLIYANELELNNFYYAGGIILSSRSFCKSKNGKIFTRSEAERWKDSAFIRDMYGANISDYEPLIMMGGYGCLHRPDWITSDIAKEMKSKK